MTTTTSRYRFEFRVNDWASKWSLQLAGQRVAIFIGLRPDGTIRRVYVSPPNRPISGEQKALLGQEYTSWLIYLPYEQDGAAYIEWLALPQPVIERWLGRVFEPADFIDVRTTGSRDGWPDSWRVIVA